MATLFLYTLPLKKELELVKSIVWHVDVGVAYTVLAGAVLALFINSRSTRVLVIVFLHETDQTFSHITLTN